MRKNSPKVIVSDDGTTFTPADQFDRIERRGGEVIAYSGGREVERLAGATITTRAPVADTEEPGS